MPTIRPRESVQICADAGRSSLQIAGELPLLGLWSSRLRWLVECLDATPMMILPEQAMANLDVKLNVLVMVAICCAGYYILTAPKAPIAPPDDAWFQSAVVNQAEPVLVKFGAEWCGPCRML